MDLVRTKGIKIKVTVQFEGPYWSAIFERKDKNEQAIVRQIFASEPTDQELYDFVSHYFYELKFKQSIGGLLLDINRKKDTKTTPQRKRKPKNKSIKRTKSNKSPKKKRPTKRKMPSAKKASGKKIRKTKQR